MNQEQDTIPKNKQQNPTQININNSQLQQQQQQQALNLQYKYPLHEKYSILFYVEYQKKYLPFEEISLYKPKKTNQIGLNGKQQADDENSQGLRKGLLDFAPEFFASLKCIIIGNLTFSYGQHLKKFKYYHIYLTFQLSFFYSLAQLFVSQELKLSLLILFLMLFSLVIQTQVLLSKQVYLKEKQTKNLNNYCQIDLNLYGRRKKEFIEHLGNEHTNSDIGDQLKQLLKQSQPQFLVQECSFTKIVELIMFNIVILIVMLFMQDTAIPMASFIQIILFQIYFSYQVVFLCNEQIEGIMKSKLRNIKKIESVFTSMSDNIHKLYKTTMVDQMDDIDEIKQNPQKYQQLKQKCKSQENLQKIRALSKKKFDCLENFGNELALHIYYQYHTKLIVGSSSSVFIFVVFVLGMLAAVDNLSGNLIDIKSDSAFMSVYICYMVFLVINIAQCLYDKQQINQHYKQINDSCKQIVENLEDYIEFTTELQDELVQNNKQDDFLDILVNEQAMYYIQGKQKLSTTKNLTKKNNERLLFFYKVNKMLFFKIFSMLGVMVLAMLVN